MSKINIFHTNNEFQRKREIAQAIYEFRKKGLVPILKDGKLLIYKISTSEKFSELQNYYASNFFDIYSSLILDNQKFRSDLCRFSYLPLFKDMINYHQASQDDIIEHFNLDNETNRKKFLEQNAQEVEVHIPVNDEIYTKGYRKETIEEVVKRVAHNYVVCNFKRRSKLSEVMCFINYNNYINLDFIASIICKFLYSTDIDFYSSEVKVLEHDEDKIKSMKFSDKEQLLSEDDKILIIKEIFNSLNIECVCCEEIDKISDFQLKCMANSKLDNLKNIIIDFASHNSDILENSVFSDTYYRITSKSKVLEKKPVDNN